MTEGPVVCRIDLRPALVTVTSPDGSVVRRDGTAVIVTEDHVYVFVDGANGPTLTYGGGLADFMGRNVTGYRATLDDGTIIDFKRSTGCACGSRIRSFRPFPQGLVQGPYLVQ